MKKALQRRRDGLYERTVTVNGKRVHFYGKTQKEVNNKVAEHERTRSVSPTFGTIAERYFTYFVNEHPSSERSIKAHVNRLMKTFGSDPADTITAKDFTVYFATLSPLSRKTVSSCRSVAQCIYNYGIVNFGLKDNPVEHRKLPTGLKKTKRTVPSDTDIQKIKSRTDVPNALIFQIALYTGMRRGEILRLRYNDIDREKHVIHVTRSVYYMNNDPFIKTPKTAAGTRDVIILDPLMALLPKGRRNDYLFGGSNPWTRRVAQRRIENVRRDLNISSTLHQMRHAFATLLYDAGIDERMSMELLGHADITTTRNIYTHISKEKRTATAAALNDYLNKD